MHYLTKRQQQVLRRMLFGDAQWNRDYVGSVWDIGGWVLPFTAADDDDLPVTTTATFNVLSDAGFVGQYLDQDRNVHYTLTTSGRMVAALLNAEYSKLYDAVQDYQVRGL